MVGRGNVFFTYIEETQYPFPLLDLRPMAIHIFQPPFDLSVICQNFRFDFRHLIHETKLEFKLNTVISDISDTSVSVFMLLTLTTLLMIV